VITISSYQHPRRPDRRGRGYRHRALIATLREFIKGRPLFARGHWTRRDFPLSAGSLRDRTVGNRRHGRIGQAIRAAARCRRVPVVYHTRRPAEGVSYRHYPSLIEMAEAVDTLMVIVPGGPATAKMINAEVMQALGPRGVIINVARGSVVDEAGADRGAQIGHLLAAGPRRVRQRTTVPDELRSLQNVVLLPHIGSASVVTRNAMDQRWSTISSLVRRPAAADAGRRTPVKRR